MQVLGGVKDIRGDKKNHKDVESFPATAIEPRNFSSSSKKTKQMKVPLPLMP